MNNLSLTFLGGAGTVTGSKTLLNFNGQKILIDCGLFQGLKALRNQNWQQIDGAEDISHVLLTHAHLDHCGFLPRLVKQGFKGQIHCTPITAKLAEIILRDSAKIQEEDAERANRYSYTKHKPAKPLYDLEDVKACLQLFVKHPFEEPIELGENLQVKFIENGHIPGSSLIRVQTGSKTLVFSGDVGRLTPLIMPPPKQLPACDLLVLESTYGDRLHGISSPLDDVEKMINKAHKNNGQILIPSFAVERAQEMIYILIRLMYENRIPRIPIYLDSPMAAAVTEILMGYYDFLKDPELKDILMKQLEIVADHRASRTVTAMKSCKIVIAGSGMITGGRILHHLAAHISNPSTVVILPGFQAPGTRGYDLANGVPEIKFFGKYHSVKAEIFQMDSLSAHADREELIQWLLQSEKIPERIVLNHGEKSASQCLRVKLEHVFNIPVSVASENMELILDF